MLCLGEKGFYMSKKEECPFSIKNYYGQYICTLSIQTASSKIRGCHQMNKNLCEDLRNSEYKRLGIELPEERNYYE